MENHEHHHHSKEHHSKMEHDHGAIPTGSSWHDHLKMMIADFRKRFWVTLVLTLPILFFSPMIQHLFGYKLLLPGNAYLLFILSSIVYFYGGLPFVNGVWSEVKTKSLGMMILIAMAISVACFYSSATVFGLQGVDFFWELATLIAIMLIGHRIEIKIVLGSSHALQLLVSLMPAEAHKISNDSVEDIPLENLLKYDIILIKPGEKVPADGMIQEDARRTKNQI